MERLYSLIGKIIENAQYVEYNLAILMQCDLILKEFDHVGEMPLTRFNEIVQEAEQNANVLSRMTLGEIIFNVKAMNRLDSDEIECLEKALKTRNYLVHQYFKKHDFQKEQNNYEIIEKEINYLTNILNSMYHLNNSLAKIIDYQQKEIDLIK